MLLLSNCEYISERRQSLSVTHVRNVLKVIYDYEWNVWEKKEGENQSDHSINRSKQKRKNVRQQKTEFQSN